MQPRNNDPHQFMLWVALILAIIACFMVAHGADGQVLRPAGQCSESELLYCDIFGLDPCPCGGGEISRVAPVAGPGFDPYLMTYRLEPLIGVTQIAHEYFWDDPVAPNHRTHQFGGNLDIAEEVRSYGFRSLKLWIDNHPFDGLEGGFCYDFFVDGNGSRRCDSTEQWYTASGSTLPGVPQFEYMRDFWALAPMSTMFIRFQRWSYTEGDCRALTLVPTYELARQLYEWIGWRDITLVITDWEQDWWPWGCAVDAEYEFPFEYAPSWYGGACIGDCVQDGEGDALWCTEKCGRILVEDRYDYLLGSIRSKQRGLMRARREYFEEHGERPALRIMHAVVVNRYPDNIRDHEQGVKTLAERIVELDRQDRPDLIGLSYWRRGFDPLETLDWLRDVTGYPPYRIYIDEFGARVDEQEERYDEYIRAFWEWGIDAINIWLFKESWCSDNSLGLFYKREPCLGRVTFDGPTPGLFKLIELQREKDNG